jgi:hypothetical protein
LISAPLESHRAKRGLPGARKTLATALLWLTSVAATEFVEPALMNGTLPLQLSSLLVEFVFLELDRTAVRCAR